MSKFIIYKLLTKLLTGNCLNYLILILSFVIIFSASGQNDSTQIVKKDSVNTNFATEISELPELDSILAYQDSLVEDTIVSDSLRSRKQSSLNTEVEYKATDSIRFDLRTKKVFLFKEDDIIYGSINLKGDYMEIDFTSNEIYSRGVEDTTGKISGKPIFKESDDEFASDEIKYNFNTKKGLITGVSTEESGGYLHGEKIKKMANNTAYIQGGRFTTCELDHPHYAFRFRKSKVIPGDKIITGPAYFEIADVPTPLLVPFGLFPNQSGKQSGIIIPSYGESKKQGFYFKDGGYYWAISDYVDLTFLGSIYTRGSWALNTKANYKMRYKYSGNLNLKYAINIVGSEGSPDFNKSKDFLIQWSHNQDPKARPKSKFSANVNIRSSSFNEYELSNTFNDRLSNTFQSSINYSTKFGENWNFNANLAHSQNTKNKTISLTLPQISLSGTRFYPFRKKDKVSALKWYDNISMQYTMDAKNTVNIADSLIFKPGWEEYFNNGMKHTIPISSSIKVLKHLNWTNGVNLTSRWYSQSIDRYWMEESYRGLDTIPAHVAQDTISGFVTANDFSFSSSFSTKIYGMFVFGKNFPVQAIRHVVTPNVSFSYRPDFSENQWGYYDTYYNPELGEEVEYSRFEGSIYGSPGSGKSGLLNFSLSNNFEMKVKDRNDTVTGTRKVILIDNLTFSTSYNLAKDSLKWAPFLITGRTRLFEDLDLRYASAWDPYILDSAGTKNLNQSEWKVNHRLFRMKDMSWTAGINYTLDNETFKKKSDSKKDQTNDKNNKKTKEQAKENLIPWSINLNYSLRYGMRHNYMNYELTKDATIVQTLGFSGNIQVTPNWKVNIRSGYDFEAKDISYTQVEIVRDLHCWEMRFSWIPFGQWQSWNFGINIKSPMFKDLKVEKKKNPLDF